MRKLQENPNAKLRSVQGLMAETNLSRYHIMQIAEEAAAVVRFGKHGVDNGSFSTWFMYHLQKEFAEITGYRTQRGRNEPLNGAASLDRPLTDESDSAVFGDLIPDQRAAATMNAIEEKEYQRQLHDALEEAISTLPPDMAEVLRLRNFEHLTLDEIGERWKLSRERIRQLENKGIRELRAPKTACILRPFFDFDFYSSSGLTAFRHSGMSIQERYLVIESERRERVQRQQLAEKKAEEQRVQQALQEAERLLSRLRETNVSRC